MAAHPFDAFIEHAAQIFAAALTANLPVAGLVTARARVSAKAASAKPGAPAKRNRRGPSPRRGTKLDMNCRVAGCKNKSGGPRHGFMCPEHQKLPQKEQQAARDAYKAKKAKA